MNPGKTVEQIEFADLFSRLREKGLRAADVARELKTSSATVSMWISGERNPRPIFMDAMRKYVARVCGGPSELKDAPAAYGVDAALSKLPEHERAEVLELFSAIVKQAERRVSYAKRSKLPKPSAGGN